MVRTDPVWRSASSEALIVSSLRGRDPPVDLVGHLEQCGSQLARQRGAEHLRRPRDLDVRRLNFAVDAAVCELDGRPLNAQMLAAYVAEVAVRDALRQRVGLIGTLR
jgi:hypothetical protein